MTTNTIIRYTVRRPGNVAWSEHKTERAAHREARKALQVTGLRHNVYADHRDGTTTGPYPDAPQSGERAYRD